MKTFAILFLGFISLFPELKSQNYTPFPEDSCIWLLHKEVAAERNGGIGYTSCTAYMAFSDTLINGILYRKVKKGDMGDVDFNKMEDFSDPNKRLYTYTQEQLTNSIQYAFSFRNDTTNKKIFMIRNGENIETLWYDFNLNKGDTINRNSLSVSYNNIGYIVDSISETSICKETRKQFHLKSIFNDDNHETPWTETLIEGMGFDGDFIFTEGNEDFFEPSWIKSTYLRTSDCNPLFESLLNQLAVSSLEVGNIYWDISPNPVENFIFLSGKNIRELELYNLTGQLLLKKKIVSNKLNFSFLPNGTYILTIRNETSFRTVKLVKK